VTVVASMTVAAVAVALTFAFVVSSFGLAVGVATVAPLTPAGAPAATTNSSCPSLKLPTPICHVIIIFLENQNVSWVLHHAPFQEYLAAKYAFASQYYSVIHYSYPNYVAATSGSETNFIHVHAKKNIVDLIRAANGTQTWMAYYEDMPVPCDNMTAPQYRIAHNPFVFYADIWNNPSLCKPHDVNFTALYAAENTSHMPNYVFIGPNNTHSCWQSGSGEKACDPWLRGFVSPMVNATWFKSAAIFITYDEGLRTDFSGINGTKGGGHVYTAVVSPFACMGHNSTTQYNHYNLMTTSEWLLGLGRTGYNDSWTLHPPMYDMFCFPNGTGGVPVIWLGVSHLPATSSVSIAQATPRSRDAFED
jgi:hypothetical protein